MPYRWPLALTTALLLQPATSFAGPPLEPKASLFVVESASAPAHIGLEPLDQGALLETGTRVRYMLEWVNRSHLPATVTMVNEVPKDLVFDLGRATDGNATFHVSVDNGVTWGSLAELKVADAKGLRPATKADVTTVRWASLEPLPPGEAIEVGMDASVR